MLFRSNDLGSRQANPLIPLNLVSDQALRSGPTGDIIRKQASLAKRVVFKTGPLSTWFYHALTAEGVPAICIEARHAQKILNETLNKTDANDADGLAPLAEAGFYKAVPRAPAQGVPARCAGPARCGAAADCL